MLTAIISDNPPCQDTVAFTDNLHEERLFLAGFGPKGLETLATAVGSTDMVLGRQQLIHTLILVDLGFAVIHD